MDDDFKMFDVHSLNTTDGIRSLLNFAEIPEELQVVQVFHENRVSGES